jgi:hypothetical protein
MVWHKAIGAEVNRIFAFVYSHYFGQGPALSLEVNADRAVRKVK